MFEHLDDPQPPRSGTAPQLNGARTRARLIVRHRRRTRIATGSAALAATAGITAAATVGLPGGRAGASPMQAGGIAPLSAVPSTVPSAVPITPAPTASLGPTPTRSISPSPVPIVTVPPALPTQDGAPTGQATSVAVPSAGTATPTTQPTQPAQPTTVTTPAHPETSLPIGTPTLSPTDAPPASTQPPASTEPPTMTAACTAEAARLRTTVEGSDYVKADPGSGVIAWSHPAGPLTTLIVGVGCSLFSPDQVSPNSPVQEFTVAGLHSWVLGDVNSGKLDLVWNSDTGVEVHVVAGFAPGADPATVTKDLLRFSSTLAD